jgi:hypothetical protein
MAAVTPIGNNRINSDWHFRVVLVKIAFHFHPQISERSEATGKSTNHGSKIGCHFHI